MGIDGPPVLPPGEEDEKLVEPNQEGLKSVETVELTPEQKNKISGSKDSILDRRGLHFSIGYLNKLIKDGIGVVDLNDLEAVADAIVAKHFEMIKLEGADYDGGLTLDDMGKRRDSIEDYILKYGLNDFAIELIDEWTKQSLSLTELDGSMRAKIVHKLRLMDFYRAGGNNDKAFIMAREAYDDSISDNQADLAKGILSIFPEISKIILPEK